MKKLRGLVLVPFDTPGGRIGDAIRRALMDIGAEVFALDELASGASWAAAITEKIRVADFLVADVTRQNPNVLYELGYAHALRKPTIIIVNTENSTAVPSDLAGLSYIPYNPANLRPLTDRLQHAVKAVISKEGGR